MSASGEPLKSRVIRYKSPLTPTKERPDDFPTWEKAQKASKEVKRLVLELVKAVAQVAKVTEAVEIEGKKFFALAPETEVMFSETTLYSARLRDAVIKELVAQGFKQANLKFNADPKTYITLQKQIEDSIAIILKFSKTEVDKLV